MQDFTLPGYRDLLRAFAALGYAPRFFHDADPQAAHLIMRHDIDYCLDYALPLAEVEAEAKMLSSYFVLMRSEFYNPGTAGATQVLKRLSAMGHEVGVHFDASQYEQDYETLNAACVNECARLEDIVGQAVRSVSFHRPAKALMGMAETLGGRVHAYQPRFFENMGYCADSQGRFRFGHPLDHDSIKHKRALQLVTHPVWWYADETEPPIARLERTLSDKARRLTAEMAENSIPYKEHLQAQDA